MNSQDLVSLTITEIGTIKVLTMTSFLVLVAHTRMVLANQILSRGLIYLPKRPGKTFSISVWPVPVLTQSTTICPYYMNAILSISA